MAKPKEKQVAKKYFIELLKTQKEIAEELGVTEKSVGRWVVAGKWKALRDARLNNSNTRAENIKKVIAELTESTLKTLDEIKLAEDKGDKDAVLDLRKETTRLAQEVGMYQKALEKMEKEFKVSLSVYLEVMEDIFKELQAFDKDLYLQSIDFQQNHLQTIAQKLG